MNLILTEGNVYNHDLDLGYVGACDQWIWSWLRKSRASHPWNQVVACKTQILKLVFNWWVFCCSLAFLKCVIFICLFLIWTFFIFIKKTLIVSWCFFEKDFFSLWKRFDFWSLELDTGKFEILEALDFDHLRFWRLKIWNLKPWDFEILNLRFWKMVTWNFKHEIWGLKFFCNLKFWGFWILKLGI